MTISRRRLAMLILSLTFVASAYATDLPVQNPGFEDGPSQTAWQRGTNGPCTSPGNAPTVYDGQTGDPSNVHTGRYSLRYTFNSDKAWQIVDGPVIAGATVTLSAWVKMPTQGSPSTKVLSLDFQGMNEFGQCIWGKTSFPEYGGPFPDWTPLHVDFVVPAAAARVLVAIHTQNGWGCGGICSNPLWVDDVVLAASGGSSVESVSAQWNDDALTFRTLVPYQFAAFTFHENAGIGVELEAVSDEILDSNGELLGEPFEQALGLRAVSVPAGGTVEASVPVWVSPVAQQLVLSRGLHQIYVRRVFTGWDTEGEPLQVIATAPLNLGPPLADAEMINLTLGPGQIEYTSLGDVYRTVREVRGTAELIRLLGSLEIVTALMNWLQDTLGDWLCRFLLNPICPDVPCFDFFERSMELLVGCDLDKDGWIGNVSCNGLRHYPASNAATGTVLGQVLTSGGEPIEGARVGIEGGTFDVRTDRAGQFSLPYLTPGMHSLVVVIPGYEIVRQPVTVARGEVQWGTIVTLRVAGSGDEPETPLAARPNVHPVTLAVAQAQGERGIQFDLASMSDVRIEVLDVSGRAIDDEDLGRMSEGPHTYAWDGTDAAGNRCKSGVYFVRVQTDHATGVGRMLLIR
jgi:hypothetical protein